MYFYDLDVIPSLRNLEANWQTILGELKALQRAHFVLWPERQLYGGEGWKVFGLLAFGKKLAQNATLCPNTMRLIESIPGAVKSPRIAAMSAIPAIFCGATWGSKFPPNPTAGSPSGPRRAGGRQANACCSMTRSSIPRGTTVPANARCSSWMCAIRYAPMRRREDGCLRMKSLTPCGPLKGSGCDDAVTEH
jgi:hypothetical protein